MTAESPSNPSEDRVWATIQTTLRPEALRDFCRDLERLYRINPYSEFRMWKEMAPGQVHAEFRNLSNKQDYSLDLTLVPESDNAFSVRYTQGIKAATRFEIQPTGLGSNLTITDDYSTLPVEERAQRLDEVDKSLPAWGQAIFDFLRRHRRWGWIAPWRWYMRRVWVPMKPSARRIVWLLYLITVVEFFFFVFVALIWWLEHRF
jgi:head-tail adaptor